MKYQRTHTHTKTKCILYLCFVHTNKDGKNYIELLGEHISKIDLSWIDS